MPSPASLGGPATPDLVACLHRVRATAVVTMEQASEMYYSDKDERKSILLRARDGLAAILDDDLGQDGKADLQDLRFLDSCLSSGWSSDPDLNLSQRPLRRSSSHGRLVAGLAAGGGAAAVAAARQRGVSPSGIAGSLSRSRPNSASRAAKPPSGM
eukprot:TRINITY_DN24307_c0_g1_i1.p2 TRINITY_DN24307_c0_g1~~TRINITY_DN24307_c0_g1_i1.p2  ORF type:complete len:156 (+),score=34.96 TRINITY_DN24307_c0_g1_i1:98-565(+)